MSRKTNKPSEAPTDQADLPEPPNPVEGMVHINPSLAVVVERMQELHDRDDPSDMTGTPTGFTDLDIATQGLQPGELIIVGGRPAMGKTTFALNIASHIATEVGLPVGIFSTESSNTQLATRLLASVGRLNPRGITSARMTDDEWQKLSFALRQLHEAPIYTDCKGDFDIDILCHQARALAENYGGKLDLLVVDKIQGLSVRGFSDGRANEIAYITRRLKALAMELACPVLATSALTRKLEERTDKRPMLYDLRDSGALEDDADLVLMLYRDELYRPDTLDRSIAEVIIAKHKNGPLGTHRLFTYGESYGDLVRFENIAPLGTSIKSS